MFPDINNIIEQLLNLLEVTLNEIMRFIEQNFGIVERIINIVNNFIAWLEGLFRF